MRNLWRLQSPLVLIAVIGAMASSAVDAAPNGANLSRASAVQGPLDPRIQQALTILRDRDPAGVGRRLADVVNSNATSVTFGALPSGVVAAFIPNGPSTGAIVVSQAYVNSPPEVVAAELAHEAAHLADWVQYWDVIDTTVGCFNTEVSAYVTSVNVWNALKGDLPRTNPTDPGVRVEQVSAKLLAGLVAISADPRTLGARVIRNVELHYGTECGNRLATDRAQAAADQAAIRNAIQTGAMDPPTSPSGAAARQSTSASAGVLANQSVGARPAMGSADPTTVATRLPVTGGVPFSATALALSASGLAGLGLGLRRLTRR